MNFPNIRREEIVKGVEEFCSLQKEGEKRNTWADAKNQKYAFEYLGVLYPPKHIYRMSDSSLRNDEIIQEYLQDLSELGFRVWQKYDPANSTG